jgi:hypothetical protein
MPIYWAVFHPPVDMNKPGGWTLGVSAKVMQISELF